MLPTISTPDPCEGVLEVRKIYPVHHGFSLFEKSVSNSSRSYRVLAASAVTKAQSGL